HLASGTTQFTDRPPKKADIFHGERLQGDGPENFGGHSDFVSKISRRFRLSEVGGFSLLVTRLGAENGTVGKADTARLNHSGVRRRQDGAEKIPPRGMQIHSFGPGGPRG